MNAQLTLADRFRAQIERPLPLPGTGDTSQRFAELRRLARLDMSLARLVEAHEDARAIAAELGTDLVDATATYGVWAASGPQPVIASGSAASARLNGTLPWCGGATIVDRALVVAMFDGHPQLFDVAVADLRRVVDDDRWTTATFADIGTSSMHFDRVAGTSVAPLLTGGYLDRPGFWHGAIGVAACWSGGLAGAMDAYLSVWRRSDPHSLSHLGAADSELAAIDAIIGQAARSIDSNPCDMHAAERRARRVRHSVERAATRALDHLQVGAGPGPLAYSSDVATRTAELTMTLRQCHGERDLEPLGAGLLAQ